MSALNIIYIFIFKIEPNKKSLANIQSLLPPSAPSKETDNILKSNQLNLLLYHCIILVMWGTRAEIKMSKPVFSYDRQMDTGKHKL